MLEVGVISYFKIVDVQVNWLSIAPIWKISNWRWLSIRLLLISSVTHCDPTPSRIPTTKNLIFRCLQTTGILFIAYYNYVNYFTFQVQWFSRTLSKYKLIQGICICLKKLIMLRKALTLFVTLIETFSNIKRK